MRAPARWPLAVLLVLARRREAAARAALGASLAEAERRCGAEEAAREALRAHRDAPPPGRLDPASASAPAAAFAGAACHAARRAADESSLAAALRGAEAAHLDARAEVQRLRSELASARAPAEALEALRRAWRAARARDRERLEEDEADDAVSARWGGAS